MATAYELNINCQGEKFFNSLYQAYGYSRYYLIITGGLGDVWVQLSWLRTKAMNEVEKEYILIIEENDINKSLMEVFIIGLKNIIVRLIPKESAYSIMSSTLQKIGIYNQEWKAGIVRPGHNIWYPHIPNLLTNISQIYQFRKTILPRFFTFSFALSGGIGAFVGTILLINLPIKILTLSVAFIVIIYITLKLIVPSWKLAYQRATKLVFIMGAGGGVLQGSAGLSAPVSITFLNSMKLERNQFIPTISVYFGVMSVFQIPTLYYYDFFNFEITILSFVSTIVLICFMPLGSWFAKNMSKDIFDKITLILLGFIALRIIYLSF